ncbi:GtrA family protein [Helicobacter sp. MIT 11-5569]|uniref:GtrA family protein n=1 Tax=Helicobacter sp. MIT 11-5569 TaxID=1548151 RepID=UPI00051FC024|nr:GtrA family protein [Helicobacter sp. MIT 11-5569]TLD82931.1 GtrA family protein [Helicobacter sp. MIT 11-5569]
MKQIVLYCLVGAINTFIGFGVIFTLMALGVIAEVANFIGYCVGIIVSFILNARFTFDARRNHAFLRFCLAMGISYLLNLLVLVVCYRVFSMNAYIAQIFSGVVYTTSGFLLSKYFVFKK